MKHGRTIADVVGMTEHATPDEPVFVLRAHDKVAPLTVREWAKLNRHAGGSDALSRTAIECAERMEKWQSEHGWKLAD